jgi:hypothetical protein
MPRRRTLLLLPLLATACGGRDPVLVPSGPISYRHLIPLPLNVSGIEIAETAPVPPPGDIGARLSPTPVEAVRIMGRDRLVPVGTEGQGLFTVTVASLVQGRDALSCLIGCRLEVLSPMGGRLGVVEAQSRRGVSGPDATRPRADEALLRRTLDDLNVEFEFQVRRSMKDWLSTVAPNPDGTIPAPGPAPVTREELPRT